MDGVTENFAAILSNPMLLTMFFVVIAGALCIASLLLTLILLRKHYRLIGLVEPRQPQAPQPQATAPGEQAPAMRAPTPKPAKPAPAKGAEPEIRVVGGVESLAEAAAILLADSILLFDLTGLPIDSYNVDDERRLAANIVDALTSLRRSNLPAEEAVIREGELEGHIFPVARVGGMEVHALVTGRGINMEDAKRLLRGYVEAITSSAG
jgi:hypothetical protein